MTATAIVLPVASKTCTTCGEIKDLSEFVKKKTGKFGVGCVCSLCRTKYRQAYRASNSEALNAAAKASYVKHKDACNERSRIYREQNIEACKAMQKAYRIKNAESIAAKSAKDYVENKEKIQAKAAKWRSENVDLHRDRANIYRKKNLEKVNERLKARFESDPIFALKIRIRNLIGVTFRRNGYSKKSKTHELLGCDWAMFKSHIERQFHNGMNWDNRGEWHIDHITPIATAKNEQEVMMLNHFTNLRPMWAKDNLAKGDQITYLI